MASISVRSQVFEQSNSFQGLILPDTFGRVEIRELGYVIVDGYALDLRGLEPGVSGEVLRQAGLKYIALTRSADNSWSLYISQIAASGHGDTTVSIDESSLPHYAIWPVGESQSAQTITETAPGNVPPLSYPQKQARAVSAMNAWRDQKRAWMLEAAERADLDPTVPTLVGKWLRAADAALKREFQDSTVDPLIVAAMALEAAKGALDVVDVDQFMQSVYYGQQVPSNAVLWVSKANGVVSRVGLRDIVDYGAGTLDGAYDPVDKGWIKGNQDGTVVIDNTAPVVGTVMSATLTDPDGGIEAEETRWQWQSKRSGENWENVAGATTSRYTVVAADRMKQFRVTASYNDNYASLNTATSAATTGVEV